MDHVVYLDAKSSELQKLLNGSKSMIIRGATGRKMPHGRVSPGDILYFINNNGEGVVRARAHVVSVINSDMMSPEESVAMVKEHHSKLSLSESQFKKWAGKRYLVLIEVNKTEELKPFTVDKSEYGNMDDWLPVGDIDTVKE